MAIKKSKAKKVTAGRLWFSLAISIFTSSAILTSILVETYAQRRPNLAPTTFQNGNLDLTERKIELQGWPNAPVTVVDIKSKGKERPLNSKFNEEDDDWLVGLSVRLKNVSSKNIVYVETLLQFPQPENVPSTEEPPLAIPLSYGDELFQPGQKAVETKNLVKAGDTVELLLPDNLLAATRVEMLKSHYPLTIRHLRVRTMSVIFDDGLIWHAGGLMRRNPKDPNRWEPIGEPQVRIPAIRSEDCETAH